MAAKQFLYFCNEVFFFYFSRNVSVFSHDENNFFWSDWIQVNLIFIEKQRVRLFVALAHLQYASYLIKNEMV